MSVVAPLICEVAVAAARTAPECGACSGRMTPLNVMHGPELVYTHSIGETPAVFTAMGAEDVTQLAHGC